MKTGDFIFGMRPECIFLNTQLGDKNPFLHNVNMGALPERSPRHKHCDLREYEGYPDLYWKLRSDTVCNPEGLESEMIDRDLYRLQQATSLKLTSFDKVLLQEPFRNWRGKSGDLLFFPVGNIKKQKKKKLNVTPEESNESALRNVAHLKSESNAAFLEIQATPIRKTFLDEKPKNWDSANFKSSQTLESKPTVFSDAISEGSDIFNDDVTSLKCRRSAPDVAAHGYDLSSKRKSGNSFASGRTYQPNRSASGRKEAVKAAVISVELGLTEDEHRPRKQNSDQIIQGLKRNKDRSWSAENITASKTDLTTITTTTTTHQDSDESHYATLESEILSTLEEGKVKCALTPDQDKFIEGRSLSASSSCDKRSRTSKNYSLPLKAVHLEVFNERGKAKTASKTAFTGLTDVRGYKLDMFNYPPSKKSPVTQSARSDVNKRETIRTNDETSQSGVKRSKSARSSRSTSSAYLKITPCF
ncbi:hypothetical protein Btru_071539 [Bulinus truncatus]|nr:hypothetical protein Btru_071539 [Bulinus truncatus]